MKTLELKFRKNGFDYEQVYRTGDIAVYRQSQGKGVWFETFVVQKNPVRIIAGITIAASESMPGNEAWGRKGWTYGQESEAMAKCEELRLLAERRFLSQQC